MQSTRVIFLDSDSNLPESVAGVPVPIQGEEQARAHGKRSLGDIFSRAFEIYKANPVMIVPSLLPIAALILGLAVFAGFMGLAAVMGGGGGVMAFSAVGGLLLFIIILIVLFFVAEGVTIEMIREASSGRKVDLNAAWEISKGKMEPLILSSLLAGIITAVGYMLLIIPGLILSFAFYFVAQAVMIDGKSGMDALKTSWGFFKENLSDALIIIIVSLAITAVLPLIPIIGALLSLLSLPYIYGLATMLYLDQKEMPVKPETKVDIS